MPSFTQDKQTTLIDFDFRMQNHKGNLYRSPERYGISTQNPKDVDCPNDHEILSNSLLHLTSQIQNLTLHSLIQSLFRLPIYWKLVPCINKRPLSKKWQRNYYLPQVLFRSLAQDGKVWVQGEQGVYPAVPNGYSLLCGEYQNRYLVAVDCDSTIALQQFQAMRFPPTVSYSSGRLHRRQFLYYVDLPVKSFKLNSGLEVRGKNLLSTLPPSAHPITGKYYWLIAPDQLEIPTISASWLNNLRPQPQVKYSGSKTYQNRTVEELLYSISPIYADNYEDWIRIGMALKDWDASLLWLWDNWSRSSWKYKAGECAYRWLTFNGSGITYRTIYYYAGIS
jgi:hypothetical protein